MNTSMLAEELAPLNAQIGQARQKQQVLEGELHAIEAELEKFSADRERLDALRGVCDALDRLRELKADELFWEEATEAGNAAGLVERARSRVARFEEQIGGILEEEATLRKQIDQCLDELDLLYEEVSEAYDREERRKEEFVVEREVSSVPWREMIMPWTDEAESRARLRRAVLAALLVCLIFGSLIPMVTLPIADRSTTVAEIPERLVKLVKKETLPPVPVRKTAKQLPKESKDETKVAKTDSQKVRKTPAPTKQESVAPPQTAEQPKAPGGGGESKVAQRKAEAVGVLAFKDAFKDLMKKTPVAKLGTEARLSKESPRVAGRATAQRSLVSIEAQGGSSGGIGYANVSRNIGNGNVDRLGGAGIGIGLGSGGGRGGGSGSGSGTGIGSGQMSSAIANLDKSSRPLSDGVAPGRTDEEIQIVFDRHKAALYRIYNRELRKDPTLRGKILMRITIEPDGAVSLCKAESTDLASPELVARIVERIKRFNFGPKEGVKRMTILYPIDFLPAG